MCAHVCICGASIRCIGHCAPLQTLQRDTLNADPLTRGCGALQRVLFRTLLRVLFRTLLRVLFRTLLRAQLRPLAYELLLALA